MKIVILFILILLTAVNSKELPAICKKDIVALEQFKKKCKIADTLVGEHLKYIQMPEKELLNISKENSMPKAKFYKLSKNYKNIQAVFVDKKESEKFKEKIDCNRKGNKLKIYYNNANRAIASCAWDAKIEFRYTLLILEKQKDKIKTIYLFEEGGELGIPEIKPPKRNIESSCYMPEPKEPHTRYRKPN